MTNVIRRGHEKNHANSVLALPGVLLLLQAVGPSKL
jgi:hypothetical protein